MFLHHCSSLSAEISTASSNFHIHLQRNWAAYVANANRAEVELIAFADGLEYTTCLYTVLYEFKAFLDVYARFLCKIINHEDSPVNGFRIAGVEGCKLFGGKLANWLTHQEFPQKATLKSLIVKESSEWITAVVNHRDTVAHYRDLPGFRQIHIRLTNGPATVNESDICPPMMPDGTELASFVKELRSKLGAFVEASSRTLPSVDFAKLETWPDASRRMS